MRQERVDRRGMAALATGHALADTCQGAVPALLPFMVAQRHYTLAAASALVLAATVSSSVIQPAFGYFADRRSLSWLMPAGILLAAVGVGLASAAPSYGLTFAAIVMSGLGVAAFHPEGSRYANYVSGARRASGMSLFSLGGNIGFALGPLLVTPLVALLGLPGALWLILPAAVVAALLARELPRLATFRPAPGSRAAAGYAGEDRWGPFALLGGVIAARTFVYFGLLTFVPLYFVRELGATEAEGNVALALILIGGALGTLTGGPLADRFGRRRVVIGSMAILPGLIVLFHMAGAGAAMALGVLVGAATVSTFSVTVVMGQEYLPSRIGVASGVTLGLSIGLGGLGAPLLGALADSAGLSTTLYVIAALPVFGLLTGLVLPPDVPARRRAAERPGDAAPAQV